MPGQIGLPQPVAGSQPVAAWKPFEQLVFVLPTVTSSNYTFDQKFVEMLARESVITDQTQTASNMDPARAVRYKGAETQMPRHRSVVAAWRALMYMIVATHSNARVLLHRLPEPWCEEA